MLRHHVPALVVLHAVATSAAGPSALALTPSSEWYGIDGNWSTLSFQVGHPAESVNVLVSTSLSEFWVVQSGGCYNREPLCANVRGNVFDPADSSSWDALGGWQLGLDYLQNEGNGDYGLDTVVGKTLHGDRMLMDRTIVAAINTTDYYTGYIGLGIAQGRFGDQIAESPLTQAVKEYGLVPSYSYGYTAGASYMGSSGVPCSLTLGGYDESRFTTHNTEFVLGQSGTTPVTLVRGISVTVPEDDTRPGNWEGSGPRILSNMSTSFTALIDSSTPFLWLPAQVCDEFADAFNLTYNDTLELYTFTDDQFNTFSSGWAYSFTFSLSSFDNTDDFGHPLDTPGVVNITITAAAFAQVLRYPFMDKINYGDPSVPYFPLRRTDNTTDTFIIGRAFMQEAYMVTRYDSDVFSIYQAKFPEDPIADAKIAQINQPENSPYPPPAPQPSSRKGLTTAQIVGIVVGVIGACLVAALAVCEKDASSSVSTDEPSTPVARIFSRIFGRGRPPHQPVTHEVSGNTTQPTEVGADAHHAVYELPAPLGPMELDAAEDDHSLNGDTDNTLPGSLPSPLSNRGPWSNGTPSLPSPMASSTPALSSQGDNNTCHTCRSNTTNPVSPTSQGFDRPALIRADSSPAEARSPQTGLAPPPPSFGFQRAPIDPSKVVCLGPLPGNVSLPGYSPDPRLRGLDVPRSSTPGSNWSPGNTAVSSNRSESYEQQQQQANRGGSGTLPEHQRIDADLEMVHVPQMAERRYSWEEERSHDTRES
ncbi:hypothetical protein BN1708_001758 [Verticillium longisporum]|uniref:Peptidase A1 domain-containing protein n=1 Tax=Verticillium longisporum TaxID=100787 RepID=A0A0G4N477_VERLO|nr:hypothetical protein BN1708_001758 [Verticillium longisporum]